MPDSIGFRRNKRTLTAALESNDIKLIVLDHKLSFIMKTPAIKLPFSAALFNCFCHILARQAEP
jgi:hypothetical protein